MYVQITKREARKFYADRKPFIMVPCKMRPDSCMAQEITRNSFEQLVDCAFDIMVNYFEYYNCNLPETGRYTHFYIHE